ncbi:MAG: LysE family translocator [Candidatus Dactylopiibacterium sp.]|nr:LysE family translocator [Candidatus Dactylopiibacterium sp.]
MTAGQLALFLPVALLLALIPGPDNLAVLALSISRGRRLGLGFALGCAAGCLNHTVLSMIGVAALLSASPAALWLLKTGGALYLAWIGWQSLRAAGAAPHDETAPAPALAPAAERFATGFRRGLFANALNPKVGLFFLAFLPQFVSPQGWPAPWQLGVLGVCFTLCSALVFVLIALAASGLGGVLRQRPGVRRALDAVAGCVFVGLALRLLASDLPARG